MPILKYKCRECGKEFAKIFSDPSQAPKECTVCRAPDPEELGNAFHTDPQSWARHFCTDCDSCEAEGGSCATVVGSS